MSEKKAVLLSIQPGWCSLIAKGRKTFELRSSKPKMDVPFQCYIYCTKNPGIAVLPRQEEPINGKVWARFTCDRIEALGPVPTGESPSIPVEVVEGSAVDMEYIFLAMADKKLYAWHISELQVFDEPKPLSDFCGLSWPPQSWQYVQVEEP